MSCLTPAEIEAAVLRNMARMAWSARTSDIAPAVPAQLVLQACKRLAARGALRCVDPGGKGRHAVWALPPAPAADR